MAPVILSTKRRLAAVSDDPRDGIIQVADGSLDCHESRPVFMSLRPSQSIAGHGSAECSILKLTVAILLLTAPVSANALSPSLPTADAPAGEGCCGTDQDQDYSFRGYTVELWDDAPTASELNCPNQDDACLIREADQILRLYHLQKALVIRAALWRAQHFVNGPVNAGDSPTEQSSRAEVIALADWRMPLGDGEALGSSARHRPAPFCLSPAH